MACTSLEQAHVLDRDHRLVGEGLDELDLALGERARLRRAEREAPITSPSRTAARRLARDRRRLVPSAAAVSGSAVSVREMRDFAGQRRAADAEQELGGSDCPAPTLERFGIVLLT